MTTTTNPVPIILIRFHEATDPLRGVSVRADHIKGVSIHPTGGYTEVERIDGALLGVFESQQQAHDMWQAALLGVGTTPMSAAATSV